MRVGQRGFHAYLATRKASQGQSDAADSFSSNCGQRQQSMAAATCRMPSCEQANLTNDFADVHLHNMPRGTASHTVQHSNAVSTQNSRNHRQVTSMGVQPPRIFSLAFQLVVSFHSCPLSTFHINVSNRDRWFATNYYPGPNSSSTLYKM